MLGHWTFALPPIAIGFRSVGHKAIHDAVLIHDAQSPSPRRSGGTRQGNPADAPQLAPAIERVIRRTGGKPRTVTADRGYGEKRVDDALHELGVRNVVIPR